MGSCPIKPDLPDVSPERLQAAVRAVLFENVATLPDVAVLELPAGPVPAGSDAGQEGRPPAPAALSAQDAALAPMPPTVASVSGRVARAAAGDVPRGSVRGRLPSSDRLRAGAEETVKPEPSDRQAAEYFQSLLELGYLVASADGLGETERDALADLFEQAAGSVVRHAELRRHFSVLDQACEILGRRARIGRLASNFEDPTARVEALSFAALAALADGHLGLPEARALLELGEHLDFTDREVEMVLGEVVTRVRQALEG